MRNFVNIVLPALASALHNPPPAQRFKFQEALRCVGALVRCTLTADYPSHNEATLDYLKQYLCEFHNSKDIFLVYREGKAADKAANVVRQSLKDEHTAESQAAQNSNPSKRHGLNDEQET
ncbi:hypothetical protein Q9L58_010308 [Maublancomyces gigas]|uniref:Uncharacterized protein n=1 Tax=Discina gigas TaxID=1032678 RepID=A0ABR3G4W2_9PEZI